MAYTPPAGDALNLDFGATYTPPGGAALNLELAGGDNRVTSASLGALTAFGSATVVQPATLAPTGIAAGDVGSAWISYYVRTAYVVAIDPPALGTASIENAARDFSVGNIAAGGFGTAAIESLLKFVSPSGLAPVGFGTTDVSHFLRYLAIPGITSPGFGSTTIEFKTKQVAITGLAAGSIGTTLVWRTQYAVPIPWESSVVPSPEELLNNVRRSHFQGFDAARYGTATVFNAQEHIRTGGWDSSEFFNLVSLFNPRFVTTGAFMGANTPPDMYGQPLVENRDRRVAPFGYPQQKFGYTFVANNAEPAYPAPIARDGYGTPVVDHVNRTRQLEGWQSSVFSPYAAIYNAAKAVYPVGMYDGGLGDYAEAINRNRTVHAHTPPEPPTIDGVGIDYALRSVVTYSIAPPSDAFPAVYRNPEYLSPAGFEEYRTGGHAVHEHFNEVRPSSVNVPSVVRVGEPYIHNRNRSLLSNGVDQAEYGTLFIENAIRTLTMPDQGINSAVYGTLSIEFRTKHIGAGNIPAARITTRHRVANLTPDPPGPAYISLSSFGAARYGTPTFPYNRIDGAGDIGPPAPPPPTVRANSIYPPVGFDHDDRIGTPRCYLYRGQITVSGVGSSIAFGRPSMAPYYIAPRTWPRGSEGEPITVNNFGDHRAYTAQDETFRPNGIAPPGVPAPDRVQLKKRYIYPDGLRSLRIGYARLLNVPQFVDLIYDGIPAKSVGTPSVARPVIPYTGDYTAYPSDIAPKGFGGTVIELFHRQVYPSGTVMSKYGTGMVGTTRWRAILPFENTRYGTQRVEFLIRTIEPVGELETLFNDEDDIGHFPRRTYVTRRAGEGNQSGPSGIAPPGFGAVTIASGSRAITPLGINASGVPRPRVSQPRSIAVLGWGGEVFGRADHWQGDLIPYSIGPEEFGLASTGLSVSPLGIDSLAVMGETGATRRIRTYGFPPVGFHGPLLLDDEGRNLQFIVPLPVLAGVTAQPEVSL